jgi:hypothetical protein
MAERAEAAPDGPTFLSLESAAQRHGGWRWVERRLYELSGSRSATAGLTAATRVHLFEAATRHAWHAQLWAERLPVLAGWDPETLTVPPSRRAEAALEELDGAAGEAALLQGLYGGVVPALLDAYRRHAGALSEAAGAPVLRVLRVVTSGTEELLAAAGPLWTAQGGSIRPPDGGGEGDRRPAGGGGPDDQEPIFPW